MGVKKPAVKEKKSESLQPSPKCTCGHPHLMHLGPSNRGKCTGHVRMMIIPKGAVPARFMLDSDVLLNEEDAQALVEQGQKKADKASSYEDQLRKGLRRNFFVQLCDCDGRSSLEDVLTQTAARGYGYLAITDHGEDLAINGVSRELLLEQRERLARLQTSYPAMRLLHGVELNIGPEGGLDYDADFRRTFDWCVAAVHSHFDLDQDTQTRRIIAAMHDPAVNVIGHLSGRMIGRRPGIELDVDAVLRAAAATGTAIEINSALPRLDAAWEVLRKARDLGVTFVVSTDAHHIDDLNRTQWGALQAQRGWVEPESIANTWPPERFLAWATKSRR